MSAGAGGAGVVAHLDLVPPPEPSLTLDPVAHRKRQVEYAMTLPDETSQRLPDGTLAYVAHRTVRDGARVGLIHIPELLRFDVHPRADCFSFTVRNLTGLPAVGPARELPRAAVPPPGRRAAERVRAAARRRPAAATCGSSSASRRISASSRTSTPPWRWCARFETGH